MAPDTGRNVVTSSYYSIIEFLRKGFRAVRSNFILLLCCIALAVGLLSLYNAPRSRQFKASFTVAYDELVRKIYGDRLYKINLLVQKGEFKKVAYYLGVDKKTASSLRVVKGKNILGEDLTQDMNTDRIPFVISIQVADSAAIPKLQAGLVSFLEEGNAYSATTKALKIKEIDDELLFIDRQMQMMDSLKRKFNTETIVNERTSSPTNIYDFSYELYNRKKELLRKKNMPNTIQIIDDAIVAQKGGLSMPAVVFFGIVGGMVLFIVTVLFLKPAFRRG
jgi:hypothetical protein